jgi:protein-S-isoprenylcysteine O-methyltransferase Ste14
MKLVVRAFGGLAFLLAVLGAALFVTAGTFDFWQAWLFLAVFGFGATAITLDLARRDPALLARRVQAGPTAERSALQKLIQSLASLAFLALFVVSGLDRRSSWSEVAVPIVAGGAGLVLLGFFFVFRVFRANTFTSATIEVARDQHVVSTGPYAVVRHPMYAGALVLMFGVPLTLGSWWALGAVPALGAVLVWRLLDEEKQLVAGLPGYEAYCTRVRYRLLPRVW